MCLGVCCVCTMCGTGSYEQNIFDFMLAWNVKAGGVETRGAAGEHLVLKLDRGQFKALLCGP